MLHGNSKVRLLDFDIQPFILDGKKVKKQALLSSNQRATWTTSSERARDLRSSTIHIKRITFVPTSTSTSTSHSHVDKEGKHVSHFSSQH